MLWANYWAEGRGGTSGSWEASRETDTREQRSCHASDGEELKSHVRSQNGMSTQAAPTGEWSGVFSRG